MKFHAPLIAASLLLSSQLARAGEFKTIPPATVKLMKKGNKLSLVWKAPDFDGSKGCVLGPVANETDDEFDVSQRFSAELKPVTKPESPYSLLLTVVRLQRHENPSGESLVRMEVEGRIVDKNGTLVAAFDSLVTSRNGGTNDDNVRLAVREISFGITKELFPADMPKFEKPSAVIVAAQPKVKPSPVIVPPKEKSTSVIVASATPLPVTGPQPAPSAPATPAAPAPKSSTAGPAKAKVTEPVVSMTPLPHEISSQMKKGKALDDVWIGPAYNRSLGFSIGEVRYYVDQRDPGVGDYLPDALDEISKKDSPYSLTMGIVEFDIRTSGTGVTNVRLAVEGRLLAKDGSVVAAFKMRSMAVDRVDITDVCRTAARKIIVAINKDLN